MNIARFENIQLLWLLAVILPMTAYYIYTVRKGRAAIQISTVDGLTRLPRTAKYYFRHVPFVLRILAITALVLAMARPQSSVENQTVTTEGIDIIVSLDISGSMLARDFQPDRITAAKDLAGKFILDRKSDRIGLVVFAGESFTQSPLTTDHVTLVNLLNEVRSGMIDDGTAIGNGLATAVNRLKESPAESKVIILLTDGVNNMGQIAPLTAAEIAGAFDIKVYTIGIGTEGFAPYPTYNAWGEIVFTQMKVEIDEKILMQISDMTGGKYFRATDNKKLQAIYNEINDMEKTKVEIDDYTVYRELFAVFALIGLGLIFSELLFRYLYLRQIP